MSTKRISIAEIILWILVVLLILISLTPFALGYKVKSDYAQLIDDFAQVLQIELQIESYDQGFYSSEATLSLLLPEMDSPIFMKEEIIHGPVYFGMLSQGKSPLVAAVVNGELDVSADQQEIVQKIFANEKPLVYQNVISFSGDVESQAYVPAINTSFEDDIGLVSIQSSGMIINEYYSSMRRELKGEAQIPGFKLQSEVFSMNTDNMTLSFSGSMGMNNIMLGDSVISIGLLNMDSNDEQFAMRDLTMRSVTSEDSELINSGAQISAREILASNQKFGPMQLNISVNGLNAQSLMQIQEMQKGVQQQVEQGIPEEQANAMMMGQIMGLVPTLIQQAEIKVNPLSIDSELGKLEADMEFSLSGIDENTPADPMFLIGAIDLDMNISIDEPLLKQLISWQLQGSQQDELYQESGLTMVPDDVLKQQVDGNIQAMLKENWLVVDEGVYFSKLSMHQGEMLINDKTVDPMAQIMSSMGQGAPAGQQ